MILRNSFNVLVAVAAILSLASASPAAAQRRASAQVGSECVAGFTELYNEIEPVPLSDFEETALLYLWEEEKLARDVYIELADTWQLPIFLNIAGAEQNHMDMVWMLFETYGVAHSFTDFTAGAFINEDLGPIYDDLVAQGNESLVEALRVGAEIEDMEIYDLYELLENTDNDHIQLVTYNLAKGSRNHLRAFMRALVAQGGSYTPLLYLDQESFDAILATEMERGIVYDADGQAIATCGGGYGGPGQRRGNGSGSNGGGNGNGGCDGTGSNDGGNGNGGGNGGGNRGGNGGGN